MRSPQRNAQLEANKVSYLWDSLIERTTRHFLDGTSHFLADTSLASHELVLRFFARESRVRRRMLAGAFVEMMETTPPNLRRLRVLAPSRPGDPHFVLLLLPQPSGTRYEEYRQVRLKFLEICCRSSNWKIPTRTTSSAWPRRRSLVDATAGQKTRPILMQESGRMKWRHRQRRTKRH